MITKTITLDRCSNFQRVKSTTERSQVGDVVATMQGTLLITGVRKETGEEVMDVIQVFKPIQE